MNQRRIFELDVLRGIAVLLVMGSHLPVVPIWSNTGVFGVDLFFVLSGFLISNLLFMEYRETGGIRLKRFFIRRTLRIYPSFYLMLALTPALCLFIRFPVTPRDIAGELTMTQNYIGNIWGHTWTLAVEEHFYLLLPAILTLMMRRRRGVENPFGAIPYVFAALAAGCLAYRVWNSAQHPYYDHRSEYEPSQARFDSLFFGVWLSYLHNFAPQVLRKAMSAPWRYPIACIGVIALAPAILLDLKSPTMYTAGFTLLYIAFGIMLLLALYREPSQAPAPGRISKAVARIGTYSYTIYLWNMPLAEVFLEVSHWFPSVNHYVIHALYFTSSIVLGVLSSKLVEIPILKLRERLSSASASAAAILPALVTKRTPAGAARLPV